VIAGRLRGRSITFADSPGLRPTGDRLRETLFSWLQPFIVESRVLDLFAGSGVLGFEAASRGAAQVTMVEKSRKVCAMLRRNTALLELDGVAIICTDALDMISGASLLASGTGNQNSAIKHFDIVFIDPPFAESLQQSVIDALIHSQRLAINSLLAIESDRRAEPVTVPANWQLQKEKIAGDVRLQLYLVP